MRWTAATEPPAHVRVRVEGGVGTGGRRQWRRHRVGTNKKKKKTSSSFSSDRVGCGVKKRARRMRKKKRVVNEPA